jgi:hypothetical protein
LEAELVVKHKHTWTFMGIILGGHRNGLAHRACRCGAELYQPTTKKERAKHDPQNEASKPNKPLIPTNMERDRNAALFQGDALKRFYEWFKEAGSWDEIRGSSQWTLTAAESLEGERLSDAVDAALKLTKVDIDLRIEAMQRVVDAAAIWNDQAPALSPVEAKLVSAVVDYKNLIEKGVTV